MTYGIDVAETDDKYFEMVERIVSDGSLVASPGQFPVEAIPQLRYIPAWFPGGRFKTFAAKAKAYLDASLDALYKTAVDGLVCPLSQRGPVYSEVILLRRMLESERIL